MSAVGRLLAPNSSFRRQLARRRWRVQRTWLQTCIALRAGYWGLFEHRRAERWVEAARRYRWIFVLGCNNSGTTLLYRLLANHPDIVPVSATYEGKNLTWLIPKANGLVAGRLFTERLDLFRRTEASPPIDSAHLMYDWLWDKRGAGGRFMLEKSPQHTVSARWLETMFPDAYFVGLVRSGYAVAEGIRRRMGCTIERSARHWDTVNRIMIEDAKHLDRFHLVSYEQLCLQPSATLRELARFLSIEYAPFEPLLQRSWAIHNADRAVRAISDFNAESLRRLSPEDVATVTATAREMLDHFGYGPSSREEASR